MVKAPLGAPGERTDPRVLAGLAPAQLLGERRAAPAVLGRLHQQANELPKARNMFERGLECDPKHDALKRALAEVPRA